jgi:hypothetical protein
MLADPRYRAAAAAQRDQSFGVALAVRDPLQWYASCVRVQREAPGFLLHDVTPEAAAGFWNDSHRAWLHGLGERSVIVNTDALREDPEPWLARMAAGLRIRRRPGLRRPRGYLHPQGPEEVYEILGRPVVEEMEREFTSLGEVDAAQRSAFARLLDRDVLSRLGLGE